MSRRVGGPSSGSAANCGCREGLGVCLVSAEASGRPARKSEVSWRLDVGVLSQVAGKALLRVVHFGQQHGSDGRPCDRPANRPTKRACHHPMDSPIVQPDAPHRPSNCPTDRPIHQPTARPSHGVVVGCRARRRAQRPSTDPSVTTLAIEARRRAAFSVGTSIDSCGRPALVFVLTLSHGRLGHIFPGAVGERRPRRL